MQRGWRKERGERFLFTLAYGELHTLHIISDANGMIIDTSSSH